MQIDNTFADPRRRCCWCTRQSKSPNRIRKWGDLLLKYIFV